MLSTRYSPYVYHRTVLKRHSGEKFMCAFSFLSCHCNRKHFDRLMPASLGLYRGVETAPKLKPSIQLLLPGINVEGATNFNEHLLNMNPLFMAMLGLERKLPEVGATAAFCLL